LTTIYILGIFCKKENTMDHKELAKKLGYKTAEDMFRTVDFTYARYYKLKPESQKLKLIEIAMKHYDLKLEDLLDLMNMDIIKKYLKKV
jgi:hypothetical protein